MTASTSLPRIGPAAFVRLQFIHQHLQSGKSCTATTLAQQLEISPRTVRRDIDLLRDRFNAPIEWEPSTQTYFYSAPFDKLSTLTLSTEEALALALAEKTFAAWRGSALGTALHTVIQKIAETAGEALRIPWDSVARCLYQTPLDVGEEREQQQLPVLFDAVRRRRTLRLVYRKPSDPHPSQRKVHPLHLTFLDHRPTLIAHDTESGEIRKFLLGRIESSEILPETFEPPTDFDIHAYLAGSLGLFTGETEYTVVVRFDAYAAAYQKERPWHSSQTIRDLPDGAVEVTYRVNNLTDIQRRILSWGHHATVLAPPELLDNFKKITSEFQKRYLS